MALGGNEADRQRCQKCFPERRVVEEVWVICCALFSILGISLRCCEKRELLMGGPTKVNSALVTGRARSITIRGQCEMHPSNLRGGI